MLTKVIFEYSDGRSRYLEGEDVQKWHTFNEQVSIIAMIHGVCPPFDSLQWKEGKDNKNEQKEKKSREDTSKENKETKRVQGGTISGGGL